MSPSILIATSYVLAPRAGRQRPSQRPPTSKQVSCCRVQWVMTQKGHLTIAVFRLGRLLTPSRGRRSMLRIMTLYDSVQFTILPQSHLIKLPGIAESTRGLQSINGGVLLLIYWQLVDGSITTCLDRHCTPSRQERLGADDRRLLL